MKHHRCLKKQLPKIMDVAVVRTCMGPLFMAATRRGICRLSFLTMKAGLRRLRKHDPHCAIHTGNALLKQKLKRLAECLKHRTPLPRFPLCLDGTSFQKAVWNALVEIPHGKTRSYAEIARHIGRPSAIRAVGMACARNPIVLLVPCHRVVCSNGSLGGYTAGLNRKKRLLEVEQKRTV